MKFSELWLREWVNPAIDSEALSDQITMAGLEVDGVEPVAGSFNGVVVGEVVECGQHPNADKLRVTKVNVGGERLLDIVCGAPNCRQGLKVAVATIGAVLPGDFKIKAAKLRGEPSEGCCAPSPSWVFPTIIAVLSLPADAPIGTDIREYLKLDDNTIEISVTPNRADCLGIIGVARDVAVLNKAPLNAPEITPVAATIDDVLPIQVDAAGVPALSGPRGERHQRQSADAAVDEREAAPLRIRSIDAVVDVTNYVLLELGQPMHAFDRDRIEGGSWCAWRKRAKPWSCSMAPKRSSTAIPGHC
jgi:phenylalanyl-tRNA synthetase beta chain